MIWHGQHGASLKAFQGGQSRAVHRMARRLLSGTGKHARTLLLGVAALNAAGLTFLCPNSTAGSDKPEPPADRVGFRVALSENAIEGSVSPDDAIAAARVWASTAFGGAVEQMDHAEVLLSPDLPRLVAAVAANQIDIIALPTSEYLAVEKNLAADPYLTYVHGGVVWVEYLFLVNRGSSFRNLAALRGKRVALTKGGQSAETRLWGDALLLSNGLDRMDGFFGEVREVQNPTQAILPVFFGQLDAAIVTRSAFESAVTLNPQLGQQLTVLATSPRMVPLVTCFSRLMDRELLSRGLNRALKLHETVGGLQSFTIFKIDRFARWEPGFADAVRDLMKISGEAPRRQDRPAPTRIAAGVK